MSACPYCGTAYDVPEGFHGVIDRTMDMEPPAHVVVWQTPLGQRKPDFSEGTPPTLHECRSGRPGPGTYVLVIDSVAVGYYRTREAAERARRVHRRQNCCCPEVIEQPWEATRYDD